MHPEVVGDNCDLRRDLVRAHSRPYPLCERSATLCEGPIRFDHPGLFSTSDLTSAERLALNELEETLALPSLEVGDYPKKENGNCPDGSRRPRLAWSLGSGVGLLPGKHRRCLLRNSVDPLSTQPPPQKPS